MRRFDLVNINQISHEIIREVGLATGDDLLALRMDSNLGLVRFPYNTMELGDLTIDKDLLVWDLVHLHILRFEELDTILLFLFLHVFVHDCEVAALRVVEHLELY